ncbi:Protein asunder [Eumeta japonica]|uniref:Protein asunder n=1 Tax=Eumeta variegata TaxID=151549 RepID=A0A4C1UTD9_EUMVA|nr:Protein asunder [Eumeta japonica]
MYPTNHKTIFVLDHTPYFGISSENPIDFDVTKGPRGPGYVPLPPICKSLWTCSVEAAVEYCRIVWDLFPDGKLVRFVVSDSAAHILNSWIANQQNLNHILNGLCLIGGVRRGAGGDVVGLCAAIEALGEPSPAQAARPSTDRHFQNRGRIICITSARDDVSLRSLAEIALNAIVQQNKRTSSTPPTTSTEASSSSPVLTIHYCHLVVINVIPEKAETLVHNQPLTEMGGGLMGVEVIVSRASQLATLLGRLVLPHYKLSTTTVTGIPMKEEQNASSSANYDVEIIHSAEAHAGLRATQSPTEAMESVVLRWWTPRGSEASAVSCGGAVWRVTPADVASRPSACLVNFLLNGRSVTLEVPRKGGGRSASHTLSAHAGELWISALGGRAPHDDPPALSDGAGGRVTDYRIKEFGALIQQNRLYPLRGSGANARARSRLQRHTTYWPLTISSTLIFNLGSFVEPLTRLVVQESLTDEELEVCRSVLHMLLNMEFRLEVPSSHLPAALRGKWSGMRREEQWRQVWGEVEALVRAHAASATHRTLLHTLLDCRAHNHAPEGESNRASVIRATTDSPLSPGGVASTTATTSTANSEVWAPRNVLDALLGAPRPPRRPDFAGRMAAGSRPATLYQHLQQDVDASH